MSVLKILDKTNGFHFLNINSNKNSDKKDKEILETNPQPHSSCCFWYHCYSVVVTDEISIL